MSRAGLTSGRYLFDEHVSTRVARALRELGCSTFAVGEDGQPAKGTEDPPVVRRATETNQTIVTMNHDMAAECIDQAVSFVWIDLRGKRGQPLIKQAHRIFGQIEDWDAALEAADEPICVRSYRTKVAVLTMEQATKAVQGRLPQWKPSGRGPRAMAEGQMSLTTQVDTDAYADHDVAGGS